MWFANRKKLSLPTKYLKKLKSSKNVPPPPKKTTPAMVFNRDIVCLTKEFMQKNGTIKIPRSIANLEYLCRNGLKGKIRLTSDMCETEIMDEIRSVFQRPFNNDDTFPFDILQSGGGKMKSLVIPSLSSSYLWTASAVAGSQYTYWLRLTLM